MSRPARRFALVGALTFAGVALAACAPATAPGGSAPVSAPHLSGALVARSARPQRRRRLSARFSNVFYSRRRGVTCRRSVFFPRRNTASTGRPGARPSRVSTRS